MLINKHLNNFPSHKNNFKLYRSHTYILSTVGSYVGMQLSLCRYVVITVSVPVITTCSYYVTQIRYVHTYMYSLFLHTYMYSLFLQCKKAKVYVVAL